MSESTDAELAALADAATPGPWTLWCHADKPYADCELRDGESGYVARAAHDNAAFIAALNPARVKRLIAEKQAAEKDRHDFAAEVRQVRTLLFRAEDAEKEAIAKLAEEDKAHAEFTAQEALKLQAAIAERDQLFTKGSELYDQNTLLAERVAKLRKAMATPAVVDVATLVVRLQEALAADAAKAGDK